MTLNGQLSIPSTENIHRVELDNGVIVLAYHNPAVQSVVISGSLHAGSLYEDPSKNGLATMTASALMRGTQKRDFDTLNSALEDIGADLNINAHIHKVGFGGKALAEDLPVLLDVLNDALRYPTFPETHVERLRGELLTYLQYSQQDVQYRSVRAFRETLYSHEHPYHYGTWGKPETIQSIAVEEMRAFHQEHYGPQGMILTIVGNVQPDDAVSMARDYLEDWGNAAQPEVANLPEAQPAPETQREFVYVPGKSQSMIQMGTLGPSRYDEDYVAATIANSVLGVFGMMGRLGKNIREQAGLAYAVYSRVQGAHGPGAWVITAGVDPNNVDVTIEKATDEIRRLVTEPVSDEDLADNQSYFTGRLPLSLESNEGLAAQIHGMESYQLGLDYLVNYHDRIYSLTQDDLLAAAQNYLDPAALVISVAGPQAD